MMLKIMDERSDGVERKREKRHKEKEILRRRSKSNAEMIA
jgi:hypothetical protein